MKQKSYLLSSEPQWRTAGNERASGAPQTAHSWLFEQGSLTKRLRRSCGGSFQVRVVRQCRMRPFVSEARALGVAAHRHAVVREVQLQCGDRPLILARTIIPFETLSGVHRRLSSLGTRPLGDIIFSSPDLRRAKMEIAEVSEWCDEIADTVDSEVPVWGRRTLYELAGRRLLVCEFFLPSVLAL